MAEVRARIKEARRVAQALPMGERTVGEMERGVREGEEVVGRMRRMGVGGAGAGGRG